jgi:hypothetical protein
LAELGYTIMNNMLRFLGMLFIFVSVSHSAEPAGKEFLRYIYGADGIELTNICHPSDDAWMLRGAKNTNALAEVDRLKIVAKTTGIISGLVGRDIYFIETRDGRVDPAFNLDGIYVMHRQLVLRFLYVALSQNRGMLGRLTTDASKVTIDGPKAAPGDMDQYGSILEMMPVVRSSRPVDDAKSRTVTYRVPIGEEALTLTLLKEGSTWKIDTSKSVRVPLAFFFRGG